MGGGAVVTRAEAEAAARPLVGTYFQTSRAHRIVVRFPEGVGPIEALVAAARASRPWDVELWARRLGERSAGDHYLRVYAPREHQLTLTREVFDAYLHLGGGTFEGRIRL